MNVSGPVPLVLDLLIAHDRFGSSSDPSINGHLHYPNDLDRSLNEVTTDKIPQYLLLFLQTHRETDRFFATSGVQFAQSDRDQFHYLRKTDLEKLLIYSSVIKSSENDRNMPYKKGSRRNFTTSPFQSVLVIQLTVLGLQYSSF